MDSSSPSTSTCDSSDRSDARNGEGLAVDEIMRMKEKRLRLLDDYRNEQEDSILPLMREADDINRKRKKKSKSQFHAENNTPLRRSERIMTQTLNENRTLESPVDQLQLEPDSVPELQHEPEFQPEPALREESEHESVSSDESEPEFEPESMLVDDSEPEAVTIDDSGPDSPPMDDPEPEAVGMDDSEPDSLQMDESESEPVAIDDSELESIPVDDSEPELFLSDESEPESVLSDDPEQQAPPRRRHMVQNGLLIPRRRFEVGRPRRHLFDVQLASRRVFAVHPAPKNVVGQVPIPRWRHAAFDTDDNWYGAREGFDIGHRWNTRLECSHDKVHRPSIAGIHPGPHGAYSVALSGAYPEDIDRGNVVIFTGAGGRDLKGASGRSRSVRSAPQVRDQELNKANLSLIRSVNTGNPVRLIRGHKLASSFAPERGYRYDGLYRVVRFWYARGHSGFRVFRFKMSRLKNQTPPPWETARRAADPRRDPTPPRDHTPPPRDPTRPSRDLTSSSSPSDHEELDDEIEDCIQKLCRSSFFDSDDYDDDDDDGRYPPPLFRGWSIA